MDDFGRMVSRAKAEAAPQHSKEIPLECESVAFAFVRLSVLSKRVGWLASVHYDDFGRMVSRGES